MSSQPHDTDDGNSVPRAVIHKKILAAAESNPSASIEALAADVDGASATLVERVLDEYGDPSADDANDPGSSDDQTDAPTDTSTDDTETMSDASSHDGGTPEHDDLTDQQRDILAEIDNHPHATQQDLADAFDVSQATISTHLNAIDGFDWGQRQAFVSRLPADALPARDADATDDGTGEPDDRSNDGTGEPDDHSDDQSASPEPMTEPSSNPADSTAEVTEVADRVTDLEQQLDDKLEALQLRLDERTDGLEQQLDDRLTALERRLDDLQTRTDDSETITPLDDSELAAKVIHACMQADTIDESEELHVIERLTTT